MRKQSQLIAKPALWLLLSIMSACGMGYYVAKIWSANQPSSFSDLYAPWWGARELFLHGRNPYDRAIAHEIQAVIYGAPVVSSYSGDDSDLTGGFAYPLYAAFLLWPAVYMPFSAFRQLFFCASLLALLGSLGLWLYGLRFRLPTTQLLAVAFFTLGSFPAMQAVKLQNLSLIAAAFVAAAVAAVTAQHLVVAGVLLAASTFKPQFTVVLIPWLAIWILGDWRRRQSLAWSFLASLSLLIGGSEWLAPGWVGRFMAVVRSYTHYTFARSLLDLWFTRRAGPFISGGLLLVVLVLCWRYRHYKAGSAGFFFATSLALAATLVVIPTLAPHAQLLLLPGFLCLLRYRTTIWASSKIVRLLGVSVWLLLAWSWIAAAGLTFAAVWLPLDRLLRWWEIPLYTSPLLPFAVLAILDCLMRNRSGAANFESAPM